MKTPQKVRIIKFKNFEAWLTFRDPIELSPWTCDDILTSSVCRKKLSFKTWEELIWADLTEALRNELGLIECTFCVPVRWRILFVCQSKARVAAIGLTPTPATSSGTATRPSKMHPCCCRANLVMTLYAARPTNVKMYVCDMQHLACKALIWRLHYAWLVAFVLSPAPIHYPVSNYVFVCYYYVTFNPKSLSPTNLGSNLLLSAQVQVLK